MDRYNNVNRERDSELQRDKYRLTRRTWLLKVPLICMCVCVCVCVCVEGGSNKGECLKLANLKDLIRER